MLERFTRLVYRWDGLRWVLSFQDSFDALPPGNRRQPPPVPSAKGLTASTTIAGLNGAPFLYERWFRKVFPTWGDGWSWEVATEGRNWT